MHSSKGSILDSGSPVLDVILDLRGKDVRHFHLGLSSLHARGIASPLWSSQDTHPPLQGIHSLEGLFQQAAVAEASSQTPAFTILGTVSLSPPLKSIGLTGPTGSSDCFNVLVTFPLPKKTMGMSPEAFLNEHMAEGDRGYGRTQEQLHVSTCSIYLTA